MQYPERITELARRIADGERDAPRMTATRVELFNEIHMFIQGACPDLDDAAVGMAAIVDSAAMIERFVLEEAR